MISTEQSCNEKSAFTTYLPGDAPVWFFGSFLRSGFFGSAINTFNLSKAERKYV